ncbi:MAG: SLBB domain-containing protein, partial [Gemmatimonadota bacterium]|nr:SLBB domain-containing protein [Gemmatimonadota bacterium]
LAVTAAPVPAMEAERSDAALLAPADTTEARAELRARLDSLQMRMAGASDEQAGVLRQQVQTLRRRLEEGDFRPGDVVQLRVLGDTLSGEYTVTPRRTLELQDVVTIPVDGLLYAELPPVVKDSLSRYLRDASIEVQPMVRVGVLGSVSSPGFYDLRPSASVADALMAAGGPTQDADLEDLEVRLGEAERLAFPEENIDLATLQELGVQRGDRFFVPSRRGGVGFGTIIAGIGAASTLIFAITQF